MGKKRKMPGLNTSSTADISFMLLIFFLVTTSMDTDQGLARTLPKPPEDDQLNNEIKVKERNILNIRINKDNYVMIGDDYASLADVKERAKEFIKNEDNRPNLPELKPKKIKELGKTVMVTENHVISVQTDRGTDYGVYFAVQDALVSAYNELRDEFAYAEFGIKHYDQLSDDQKKAVREVYPQKISEAEPKKYGGQQ
jgi:biopolymer transport protein ExbD